MLHALVALWNDFQKLLFGGKFKVLKGFLKLSEHKPRIHDIFPQRRPVTTILDEKKMLM